MQKDSFGATIHQSKVFRIIIFLSILGYLVSGVAASPPQYAVNATGWWNETGAFNPAPANPIQAALTNASAGSVVTVVEQTSYPSSLVFDAKPITLDLNGSRLDGSTITNQPGITLPGANGVTIKNGEIASFQDGIQFKGSCEGVSFSDVAIVSSRRHGIYFEGDCRDTVFSNVTITDPTQAGITKNQKYSNLDRLTFRDCTVINAGADGIALDDYYSSSSGTYHVSDIVLSNVTVMNAAGTGILIGQDRTSLSRNVTVRDCTVEGAGKYGVELRARGTAVIDGIETRENGETGEDNVYYGLALRGYDAPAATLLNLTVEKNRNGLYLEGVSDLVLDDGVTVQDNGGYPYNLRTCDNITVRDETFAPTVRPYLHGLFLASVTNSTFENITVASPDQHGVYFVEGDCTDTVFSNITITDPTQAGITKNQKYNNLDRLTFRDCTVINAGTDGIALDDYYSSSSGTYHVSDIVLSNVTVQNAKGTGILVGQDRTSLSRNVTVRDCTVEGAGQNGVRVLGRGGVVIDGVEARENGETGGDNVHYGLYLKGIEAPDVTLLNLTVEKNRNGLYLEGVSDLSLQDGVTVQDNGGYPYNLRTCDNITVRDEAFTPTVRPYLRGFFLTAVTNSTFENISITKPSINGVWFEGDCRETVFSNITITDPAQAGITKNQKYSNLDHLTFRDCTVINAGADGIALDDYYSSSYGAYHVSDIVLSNVTVMDAAGTGILIGQDRTPLSRNVTVRDCTVEGAAADGIRVLGRGEVVIDGVETRENGDTGGDGTYYGLTIRGFEAPTITFLNTAVEKNRNGLYLERVSDLFLDDGVTVQDNGGYPYNLRSCDNITVRDGAFTPTVRPYLHGFSLNAVTNSTFENISITEPSTNGIWFEGDCRETVFSNITITDPAQAGITKNQKYSNLDRLTVRDCTVINASADGIALDDYYSSSYGAYHVSDVILSNVTVLNATGTGILVGQDRTPLSRNVTVRDCTVEGAGRHGIELKARGTTIIDGIETRENGETGGDNTYYGLALRGYDAPTPIFLNITVEKNRNGLYLEGVADLFLNDGVTVQDNGGWFCALKTCDNVTIRDLVATPAVRSYTRGFYLSSVTDSTFENLTVAGATEHAVIFEGTSTGLAFDGLVVTAPGINGIYFNGNCRDTVFSNITITDPTQAGISKYYKSSTLENLAFRDCAVIGAGTDGIALDDYRSSSYGTYYVRDLVLSNVTVQNAKGTGILVGQDRTPLSRNVTVRDCTVEGSRNHGIDLRVRGEVVIDGVRARGNGDAGGDNAHYGLYLKGIEAPDVTLLNLAVENNRNGLYLEEVSDLMLDEKIAVRDNGGFVYTLRTCDNITVRDLTADPTARSYLRGLTLTSVTNSTLENITISGNTDDAIIFEGTSRGLALDAITITKPGQNGIWFNGNCRDTVFSNITVIDPAQAGIMKYYRSGDLDNLTFQDCTVTGAHGDGVALDDSSYYGTHYVRDIVLANLTVRNATGTGILVGQETDARSMNLTLRDCAVESAGKQGIQILGRGKVVLDSVRTSGNGDASGDGTYYGLSLKGIDAPSLTLLNLTVENNRNGLYLEDVSDLILVDDEIAVPGNGGFVCVLRTCDNITVSDHALGPAVRPYLRGLTLTSVTNSTLENITISGNTGDAVVFEGTSTDLALDALTITKPGQNGIWFNGDCENTVFSNLTIVDAGQAGIMKYYRTGDLDNLIFQDCTVTGSGGDGIALDDSSYYGTHYVRDIVLANVTASNTTGNGILVGQDTDARSMNLTLRDCTVEGSGTHGIELRARGDVRVLDCEASRNVQTGMVLTGIERPLAVFENATATGNNQAMQITGANATITNSALAGTTGDLDLRGNAYITLSNTTHDRAKVTLDGTSRLAVLWPLVVRTTDLTGNVVAGADVTAADVNGTVALAARTGTDGRTGPHLLREYTRNGTAPAVLSTPYTLTASAPIGSASATTDLSGPTIVTLSLFKDTEPPAITYVAPTPEDGARSPANVTVRVLVTDDVDVAGVLLEVNGVNATMNLDGTGTTVYASANITGDGIHRYRVYADDSAGNMNATATRSVGISTTPPPGVTGLAAATISETAITWTWTDPADPTLDRVMLSLNGTFLTNISAGVGTYTTTGLAPDTAYLLGTRAVDFCGQANATWVNATARTAPDRTPPAGVTDLTASTISETTITWTWTDPTDADFDRVMLALDGTVLTNVSAGVGTYTTTGLEPDTAYILGTRTVDTADNLNQTWVSATARTAPDRTPPDSVTDLIASMVSETAITWTWTDPADADFAAVRVYWEDTIVEVPAGDEHFNATGLVPDTEYRIGTRTVDTAGNLNQTWVNATARTASVQPTPTPTSSSSGSGGGNSRASAASAKPLLPDQQSSLSFKGTAIYVIDVTAADATRDLLFTVEDAGSLPAGIPRPDEETYCIEHVEQYRTSDSDIATATIRFSVSKAWLDERGYRFSDIVLLRFHEGAWTEIPTTFDGEKGGHYYYSAETPGFSYFAVVCQENGTIVPEVTAPVREAAANTSVSSEPTPSPVATETTPTQSPSIAFGTLGTLLAIAATCGVARTRKR